MLKTLITITIIIAALFTFIPHTTKLILTKISQYTTVATVSTYNFITVTVYTKAKRIFRHIRVWDYSNKA